MRPANRSSLYTLLGVVVFSVAWWYFRSSATPASGLRVTLSAQAPEGTPFDLFCDTLGTGFSGSFRVRSNLSGGKVVFHVTEVRLLKGLRIDLGEGAGTVLLSGLRIEGSGGLLELNAAGLQRLFAPAHAIDSTSSQLTGEGWSLQCTGADPFIVTRAALPELTRTPQATLVPFAKALFLALCMVLLLHIALRMAGSASARSRSTGTRPSRCSVALVILASAAVGLFTDLLVSRVLHISLPLFIEVEGTFPLADRSEVYYAMEPGAFAPMQRISYDHAGDMGTQVLRFTLTGDPVVHFLRFDPGSAAGTIWLDRITVGVGDASHTWQALELERLLQGNHLVRSTSLEGARLRCELEGSDPFMLLAEDLGPLIGRLRRRADTGPYALLSAVLVMLFFALGAGRKLAAWNDSKRRRAGDMLMVILFCTILSLPLLTAITGTDPQLRNTEKRKLTAPPDPSKVMDLPADFTRYYEENFSLRRILFRWNSLFHLRVLGGSPLPDRVITGKDGWLFQYNDQVLGAYRGIPLYTHAQLESIRLHYEERQRWLASQGIRYYILIPPLSGNINREHMPDRIHRVADRSWVDEVKAHFDTYSTVPIIDPGPLLREAKKGREVYFLTDMHWNPYGAYFGYKALMDRIHLDDPRVSPPLELNELTFRNDTNQMGDLAEMLAVADVYKRVEPIMTPVRPVKAVFTGVPDLPGAQFFLREPHGYAQPDTTLPRLLMYHDSFGLYLEPLMNEHFSSSTYVWSALFIPEVVATVKPDIVVQEFMEMFIVKMPSDTLPLTRP